MKRTILLVSGLIISTLIFCQNNYYWQNPRPQGANLQGVFFVNPLTGWMVGDAGTIIHTLDGGITWETQNSGVPHILSDAFFIDENTGWVVGGGQTILHTLDGGQSWEQQDPPSFLDLSSVYFLNADTGWAFGSYKTVIRTTDGGQNWELLSQGLPNDYFFLNEGVFLDYTNGWAVGGSFIGTPYGRICHSTDGGDTWQDVLTTNYALNSISFPDPDTGFICGNNGIILKTVNGGQSWTTLTTGFAQFDNLHISFSSPDKGFVLLQENGLFNLIRTSDGGLNWDSFEIGPPQQECEKIFCAGDSSAFAAGYNGLMLRTTNFGQDWQELSSGSYATLNDICFTDNSHGWAAGYGYPTPILHTVNSGQTWEGITLPSYIFFPINRGISFYNNNEGIVVGDNGSILKTSDEGANWDTISKLTTNILWRVGYFDRLHPVIAGWGGVVLTSSDGGNNWALFQSGKNAAFTGLCILDSLHAYIAGYYEPQILYTEDRGATWNEIHTGTANEYHSVFFINQQEGWIGCENGVVLHTSDAGQTWDSHSIAGGGLISMIHFFDPMNGEAMDIYTRYYSSDGGVSWSAELLPFNRVFRSAWYYNQHMAWFAGSGGTILLSSDSVTGISDYKIKNEGLILYPNPASTRLTIESPATITTGQLSILNLTGQTIIHSPFTGSRIQPDISSLPAGVYIVRLMNERTVVVGKIIKQ